MTDRPTVKKVAVFGHFGRGNLGDEATLATVIQNVRARFADAEICAFTMNPVDSRDRHKVAAFRIRRVSSQTGVVTAPASGAVSTAAAPPAAPQGLVARVKRCLRTAPLLGAALLGLQNLMAGAAAALAEVPFLLRANRQLKGTDLFIVAGGGQLGDYFEGPWGYPFTILKWTVLAKARGARVAFLSCGAGPLNGFLGKLFCRWALSLASYRSFRDEGSRKVIETLGTPGENRVFPDLVHGLQQPGTGAAGAGAGSVVGINPLPFHDARYWAEDSPDVYRQYVEKLAAFAAWLIEAGHRVLLFPTQVRADPPVIRDVAARVRDRLPGLSGDALECPRVGSFDELFAAIARTDVVVASRYHGIVISLLIGRPVIGLSYNQKTDDLMADIGLAEFVADIGRFDVPWLISRFECVAADPAALKRRIESRGSEYRSALEGQYDHLLGRTKTAEPPLVLQPA